MRRAFALPLVLMLTLVASIVVSILLGQQSTTSLAVARQVRGYQGHHDAAGVREITSRWLTTVRGQLHDMIDEDDLAFRIQLERSGLIEVRMRDGQGPVVAETSTLGGRRKRIVARMNELLEQYALETPRDPDAEPLTRRAGPPQVSYIAAPREVLEALLVAVLRDERMLERAARIVLNRDAFASERFPVKKMIASLREQGLEQRELSDLEGMLTDRNSLWFVTVDMIDHTGRVYERAGGLYEAEATAKTSDAFNQNVGFLTWDNLPLE